MTITRNSYTFLEEPKGDTYYKLIDYAISQCGYAILVVSDAIKMNSERENLLAKLSPFLENIKRSSEWPGTKLFGGDVPVYTYYFDSGFAEILKSVVSGLYQWQQPDFPEDLCLLREDRSPWLVDIAHEEDSFLVLSPDEYNELVKMLPEFRYKLKEDQKKADQS